MKCEKCGITIEEPTMYQGKILCEDCCFDAMSPPNICDPLAVHSTLTIRKELGQTGTEGLTDVQRKIYQIVISKGKVSKGELSAELNLSAQELDRQFAVLRHCELLRAFKEGDRVFLTKFS